MIIKSFDNGWGHQYRCKKAEVQVVNKFLAKIMHDQSRTVVINSVWYTQDFHQQVMTWLCNNIWDRIILVAMLDAAIAKPDWYREFDRPVIPVGYYAGPYQFDLWAYLLENKMDRSVYGNLLDASDIEIPFICLNRKPHWHRKKLFSDLQQNDLLERGIVTMGSESGPAVRSLPEPDLSNDLTPNSTAKHYGIPNDIASLGPPHIWRRCFFNLVTETDWDINSTGFVSEKIYKPVLGMRPFVVYDPDGGEAWLWNRGFETYRRDFLDISSHDPGDPEQVINFLTDLARQPKSYLQSKFISLADKAKCNQDRFYRYVKEQQEKIDHGIND